MTMPAQQSDRPPGSADVAQPHLALKSICKTYGSKRGPVHAVEDVSFSLAQNEFLSIVGPSGCGKSTLLMMVAGLVGATSGAAEINGKQVKSVHPDLGIVFQRDALLDWRNVLRNVMIQVEMRKLDARSYRARANELLELVGLSGFEDRYPYELSGGMRQRVAICRALIHAPELLLMDEPFGALDALTRERMTEDLLRIHAETQTSVMFITHSIPEAVLLSDRIVVMSARPGRVVEVIDTPLPRPRVPEMATDPRFVETVAHIRAQFTAQGVLS